MADTNYKDLLDNLLKKKDQCHKRATLKLAYIEEALERCTKVEKHSYDEIRVKCKSLAAKVQQSESTFLEALDRSTQLQKNSLLKQKLELQSTLEELTEVDEQSKLALSCAPASKHQDVALTFLPKVVTCFQHFVKDEEEEFYPVHFVSLDLLDSFNPNKLGYLEYEMIDFSAFHLSYLQSSNEDTFMVWVPQNYDVKKILKYFSWSVDQGDNNVQVEGSVSDKNFILRVSGEPGTYMLSFCIYYQHIAGSPSTFQITDSSDILPGSIPERSITFMDEDDESESKESIDQNANLLDSLLEHKREPGEGVAAHSSPISSPTKEVVGNMPDRKRVSRSMAMAFTALRRPRIQPLNQVEIAKSVIKTEKFVPITLKDPNLKSPNERATTLMTQRSPTNPDSKYLVPKTEVQDFSHTYDAPTMPGAATLILDQVIIKEENLIDLDDKTNKPPNLTIKKEDDNESIDYFNDLMKLKLEAPHFDVNRELFPAFNAAKTSLSDSTAKSCSILRFNPSAKFMMMFKKLNKKVTLQKPIGVAQRRGDDIVIADTCNNRMVLVSREGEFIKTFNAFSALSRPSAVVGLPDGKIAVKDDKFITIFSTECKPLATLGSTYLQKPFGLTYGNGALITVDTGREPMLVFCMDPIDGKILNRFPITLPVAPHLQKYCKLRFITFREPSHLLIVDLGLNFVYIYNMSNGQVLSKFGGSGKTEGLLSDPSGIACDSDGYILVGDSRNHRIQIFSPEGEFVSVLKVDRPLKRPSGLSLTQDGKLLVCNYWEDAVIKYDLLPN